MQAGLTTRWARHIARCPTALGSSLPWGLSPILLQAGFLLPLCLQTLSPPSLSLSCSCPCSHFQPQAASTNSPRQTPTPPMGLSLGSLSFLLYPHLVPASLSSHSNLF